MSHDKDWYKDILVVKGEWEGDIFGDRVQNTPSVDLNLNNNIKPLLIDEMQAKKGLRYIEEPKEPRRRRKSKKSIEAIPKKKYEEVAMRKKELIDEETSSLDNTLVH
ncbi:hypothetical protein COP2_003073 [Malus domestica]